MLLDGLDADLQRAANLLVAQPQGNVTQHLGLALGQGYIVIVENLPDLHGRGNAPQFAGLARRPAFARRRDRGDDVVPRRTLQHVVAGPQRNRPSYVRRIVVRREHHHAAVGHRGMERLQHGEPVAIGHTDVKQNDVGLDLLGLLDGLFASGRFGHDLNAGPGQQAGQSGANDLVVIANQKCDTHQDLLLESLLDTNIVSGYWYDSILASSMEDPHKTELTPPTQRDMCLKSTQFEGYRAFLAFPAGARRVEKPRIWPRSWGDTAVTAADYAAIRWID